MREIKFREVITDQWGVFNHFHYWGFIDDKFIPPVNEYNISVKYSEQYTGLKDKKRDNAEVYQGDIYTWCGLTLPITIDDYHGYRFMFGKDQLVKAYIENGEYQGNINEVTK